MRLNYSNDPINSLICKLQHIIDLTIEESYLLAKYILGTAGNSNNTVANNAVHDTNNAKIAVILTLLSQKGECCNEIVGFVQAIRETSLTLDLTLKIAQPVVDIVGTGGDYANTLNISTASALLTAACGIPVVKHGNRSVSSQCGSADVLEALGFKINLNSEESLQQLATTNFTFCFAPLYHKTFLKVREIRRQLPFPTIFNLLGPLLNPTQAPHLIIGVYDPNKVAIMAAAIQKLGTKLSIVFSGCGIDELSTIGNTIALLVSQHEIKNIVINPSALGLKPTNLDGLSGRDAQYNANIIYDTLSGIETSLSDSLILNAATALFIHGTASTLEDGVSIAKARLQTGNILYSNKLESQENDERRRVLNVNQERNHEPMVSNRSNIPKNMLAAIVQRKYKSLNLRQCKSLKQALNNHNDKHLGNTHIGVIAEIKRASPSMGKITTISNPAATALKYVAVGATAISVLTDIEFDATIDDLKDVSKALHATTIPILRKDFILHPIQIAESYNNGADAILLMVSVLGYKTAKMVDIAHQFGLEVLVEVHDLKELEIALKANADIIGVNQRDLTDFSMHPQLFAEAAQLIPANVVKIAESGIKSAADADLVFKLGYNGVLVGEALSRLADPTEFFSKI
jgi:anthranilate phosphoribosyltransferase